MFHIHLPLNPVPASRPRVTRWGVHYGKRHEAFRSQAKALLEDMRDSGTLPSPLMGGRLIAWVHFQVQRPKVTKLELPRGDVDNYAKLLFDCCSKFIYEDDVQIEVMSVKKSFADEGSIDLWLKGITS